MSRNDLRMCERAELPSVKEKLRRRLFDASEIGEETRKMMAIKRILVPIDFSAPSLKALDEAVEFNQPYGAEIILLCAVEHNYYESLASVPNSGALVAEEVRAAQEKLEGIRENLAARGVKCRALVELSVPFQAIVDAAKKVDASLIFMSTHGRTGLAHVLVGSVAERVVQHAGCPILLLRSSADATKPKNKTIRAKT